jgi:hypothetical protein
MARDPISTDGTTPREAAARLSLAAESLAGHGGGPAADLLVGALAIHLFAGMEDPSDKAVRVELFTVLANDLNDILDQMVAVTKRAKH